MKSLNGFLQNLDNNGINRSNLKVCYDFFESGVITNKAPNYSGQFNGVLSGNPTTFFHGSGTGFVQDDFISMSTGASLFSSNFTHIFTISRGRAANDNLFSSIGESVVAASGYNISTNDAGKLLFQYKDCSGPKAITSDFSLNLYSHFAVSKQGDVVNLYQYTPVTDVLDQYTATVNNSEIFTSNYADLFFANTAPIGFLKDNFSGYAYDYCYFDVGLSPTQIKALISGLYTDMILVTGQCGYFDGTRFIMPTGASAIVSGTAPASVSLNRNGIVLMRSVSPNDVVCIDYSTGNDGSSWNKIANFNNLDGDFYLQDFSTTNPIVFVNGVLNLSGISFITGQYCGTGRAFQYDYQFSGNQRIANNKFLESHDVVLYDIPSSQNAFQRLHSGTNSVNISAEAMPSGKVVYVNGLRQISGLDWTASGATIAFTMPLVITDKVAIDFYKNGYNKLEEVYRTGWFYTSGAFAQNTARAYLNGQRLAPFVDFLEIQSGSLLQGDPIQRPETTIVTIDSMEVWNI